MSGKYHQYSHISCNSRFRQCSTTGTILTKPIITTLHNVVINYLGIKGHVKISFKSRFCHGYTIIVEKSAPVSHWSIQSGDLRESHYTLLFQSLCLFPSVDHVTNDTRFIWLYDFGYFSTTGMLPDFLLFLETQNLIDFPH